jgi:hypothetical protein
VEGLCQGIDEDLVTSEFKSSLTHQLRLIYLPELGEWTQIPTTYAGGAKGKVFVASPMLTPGAKIANRHLRPRPRRPTFQRASGFDLRKVDSIIIFLAPCLTIPQFPGYFWRVTGEVPRSCDKKSTEQVSNTNLFCLYLQLCLQTVTAQKKMKK